MLKENVIKLRDRLKNGKNYPLTVYINNLYRVIDESNTAQRIKWDDQNGILFVFALENTNLTNTPSNTQAGVSVFAVDYEVIECMEIASLPLSDLKSEVENISTTGTPITKENQQVIVNTFTKLLERGIVNLTNADINKIMQVHDEKVPLNDKDDYYNGKYTQPFKETRDKHIYNKYVESLKEDSK